MTLKTYPITGMDCADCARTVEKGVAQLPGVQSAACDFATAKLRVQGNVAESALRQRVEALGYKIDSTPTPAARPKSFWQFLLSRSETRLALLGTALILIALALQSLTPNPSPTNSLITDTILIFALILTAFPIARSGFNALRINREFNINFLMTVAAVGAVVIGEPLEAATLIVLFALAEALEAYTTDRARDSLRGLLELAPAKAVRRVGAVEEEVPVEALRVADEIIIRPGERVPMDGVVLAGYSAVNQAPITGESVPVEKQPADTVYAGTLNGTGALTVCVTHLAQDNTLSRIIHLVEEAQSVRAPSQKLIDQFARWYTPLMMGMAVLVAVVPPLFFNQPFWDSAAEHGWLYRALALLVIACPCALVISAPVTIISALTASARRGVLIKGGAHLEKLGQLKAFAFDKTGTLTQGQPAVTQTRALECLSTEPCAHCDDVLALASALEKRSTHPLAHAVLSAAEMRGLSQTYAAESVTVLAGRGLQGSINGKLATLGNHSLFEAEHPHTQQLCTQIEQAEARGHTTMLVCDGDRVRGFIAVADTVRTESAAVVAALQALGCKTVLLTGDNATVAHAVAAQVGVDDVRANLLPAHKFEAVKKLRAELGAVGMVGDGINDTPALAAADVGVALGGAASAQAIETADVVLMASDLRTLPFSVRLSRFTRGIIWQNIAFSLGTKLIFALLALGGVASLWLAVLGDMGVSLLVTANGLRPRRC
ncbi:MAG: heavy metal translocating P-type ATPase [Anaerolineales bacterium]|nr:heavy metal translocating P-type ATPase [Anaerolineales bacterium]